MVDDNGGFSVRLSNFLSYLAFEGRDIFLFSLSL